MTMNFTIETVSVCKEPVGLEMALACPVLNTYKAGEDLLVEVADENNCSGVGAVSSANCYSASALYNSYCKG